MDNPTTPLETAVHDWYQSKVEDGYPEAIDDLLQHGCQSGMVSELIYGKDTRDFYLKHQREIQALITELAEDCGCSIGDLLRDWDKSDPFANEAINQNILAWFGFEETARRMYDQ